MSMGIDFNKPLTPEERAYLNERGQLSVIERVDALHGVEDDTVYSGDGTGPRTQQLMTGLASIEQPEILVKRLEDLGYKVTIEPVNPAGAPDEDEEGEPYEVWPPADLKAEIDRRNASKADGEKISKAGGKQDLVDRLYADDEAAAAPQQ